MITNATMTVSAIRGTGPSRTSSSISSQRGRAVSGRPSGRGGGAAGGRPRAMAEDELGGARLELLVGPCRIDGAEPRTDAGDTAGAGSVAARSAAPSAIVSRKRSRGSGARHRRTTSPSALSMGEGDGDGVSPVSIA